MSFSVNRWIGKVAVVTGASSGIGAAIAKRLVIEGLQVVGLARRVDLITKLSENLKDQKGKLHPLRADVCKENDLVEAFDWIMKNLGPVHILINNAGTFQHTNLCEGDTEKWKQVLNTNVLGLCIATKEAITNMKAHSIDGHIIHINSTAGHVVPPYPNLNLYPASKYAVTALAQTLRRELDSIQSKIKVTSLSPGTVATAMTNAEDFDIDSETIEKYKNMKVLQPDDIAETVVYILSTPPHVQIDELSIKSVGDLC